MRWTFENGKQVDEEEQERIAEMLKRWRQAEEKQPEQNEEYKRMIQGARELRDKIRSVF